MIAIRGLARSRVCKMPGGRLEGAGRTVGLQNGQALQCEPWCCAQACALEGRAQTPVGAAPHRIQASNQSSLSNVGVIFSSKLPI